MPISALRRIQGLLSVLALLLVSLGPLAIMTATASSPSKDPAQSSDLYILATSYNGTVVPYSVSPSSSSGGVVFSRVSPGVEPNSFGANPGWICFSPTFSLSHRASKRSERTLYVADGSSGSIYAARLDTVDPFRLIPVGDGPVSSKGIEPVSCSVGYGPSADTLFVANYGSGNAAFFRLDGRGAIDEASRSTYQFTRQGTGPVSDRQDQSYAHQTQVSPTGEWVYICDLGGDVVHRFRVSPAPKQQGRKHDEDELASIVYKGATEVQQGAGPRHITFYPPRASHESNHPHAHPHPHPHPRGPDGEEETYHAYLANELDSTVSAFLHSPSTGSLTPIGKPLYPFPPGTPLSGPNILPTNRTTAEIEVSPDGRYVYVSNRGDRTEDHISIFRRDRRDGSLSFVKWVGSGGLLPRHFSLSTPADGDGAWMVVAHQDSADLVLFRRDLESGDLTKVGKVADAGTVVFAGFVPA